MLQPDQGFLQWYKGIAQKFGLPSNPNHPNAKFNYQAAFKAGAQPNQVGQFPQQFAMNQNPALMSGNPRLSIPAMNAFTPTFGQGIGPNAAMSGALQLKTQGFAPSSMQTGLGSLGSTQQSPMNQFSTIRG